VDLYEIYRNKQQGTSNTFNLLTTNNQQQTTYIDTNLTDTITYCYRIKAVDTQSGYSAWSDSICKEPFDYPVPDTSEVIRTTVTKTGKTNGSVKVFWQCYPKNDTFARGYEIYHTTGQKPNNFQLIANIESLSDTTFTHKGINTSDDVHNYRVLVYNLCKDQGGFFNTHQPVNLSATNQNLSIKLDWVPYRGFPVQDYRVQKSVDGGPFRNISTLNGSDTSLVDSNIRCGIEYSYKVFADGRKAQETSVSDTIIRTGFDTIPADRPDLHRATVTATDDDQGEVELLFKGAPQANRKGYVISRQQGSTFQPLDTILTAQQTNLTYTANKLNTAQTSQPFYIKTIDSCGNTSLPSDTHRTIALTATPKNAYVQLKWSAYQDWNDRTYQVQRRQSSAPWQTLTTLDSGQLTYRDSNVTCQKVYQYRIIGEEKGTSYQARSNTDTAKAFESTPPAPPVIRRASVAQTSTSNGKVNITWIPSTSRDAVKYTIYRSLNGQDYQFLDTVASTSYTDQGLNTYNQPYHYRLKAIDSCDNLSDSFSTPHRTINLEANGSEEAVILSWTAYKGRTVSQYQVLRGREVLYTVSGEQTFFRDEKVVCDTFYNYQVRALMEGDTSIQALSNTDSAKATDNTPPRPIYLQRASVTSFNDVVEVKWQASEAYDAQAYQIYRRNENTGDFNQITQIEHPNTTYQDSFAINNREVCYFVKVKDACGNRSEFSNRGCIIQPEGEALDLENELSWPPYEKWKKGIRTYEVFKQTGDSTYQSLARLDSSRRSYLDQDLRDSADQFCYYIKAEGFGEETFSRSTRICLEQSAVVYIPNTFSPGVTPNLNDQFGPEGLYIANYEMQIYNRWGEQVFSTSKSEEWDGTYRGELVPQGVYHYQIVVRSEDGSRQTYSGVLTVIR
jgi:gliding motility-associated-like protein